MIGEVSEAVAGDAVEVGAGGDLMMIGAEGDLVMVVGVQGVVDQG